MGQILFTDFSMLNPARDEPASGHELLGRADWENKAAFDESLVAGPRLFIAGLIIFDDDPLKDLSLLEGQGAHLAAIIKGGRFYKSRLEAVA